MKGGGCDDGSGVVVVLVVAVVVAVGRMVVVVEVTVVVGVVVVMIFRVSGIGGDGSIVINREWPGKVLVIFLLPYTYIIFFRPLKLSRVTT